MYYVIPSVRAKKVYRHQLKDPGGKFRVGAGTGEVGNDDERWL